ncbi:hypothetical protein ACTXGQ_16880 [Marinobacter sp. 1Y8]
MLRNQVMFLLSAFQDTDDRAVSVRLRLDRFEREFTEKLPVTQALSK